MESRKYNIAKLKPKNKNEQSLLSYLINICKAVSEVSEAVQSCLIVCDPTDCSTPGFPVHH